MEQTQLVPSKKLLKRYVILGVIVLVLLLLSPFIYTAVILYGGYPANGLTNVITQRIAYPAAIVGKQRITYHDYVADVNQIEQMNKRVAGDPSLANGVTLPTRAELAESELDRLIDKAVLEQTAQRLGVTVTAAEVDTAFTDEVMSQSQTDEATINQTLQELYGWTITDFKTNVLQELVLRQKVNNHLLTNDKAALSAGPQQTINDIAQQLTQDSNKFVDLAKQYSEDGTKDLGGDLDWIKKGDTVPAFEAAAFALTEPNQISPVVETEFGFHLIQLIEKKAATDTEPEQVHVRHILIKFSLDDYLKQQRAGMRVWKWVKTDKI
ncbi:MAG: peptidylprolyl isomerase [Patescibacteria group bacterium]|jgi:parvulin-like peptidyl-prolyl isomerase